MRKEGKEEKQRWQGGFKGFVLEGVGGGGEAWIESVRRGGGECGV